MVLIKRRANFIYYIKSFIPIQQIPTLRESCYCFLISQCIQICNVPLILLWYLLCTEYYYGINFKSLNLYLPIIKVIIPKHVSYSHEINLEEGGGIGHQFFRLLNLKSDKFRRQLSVPSLHFNIYARFSIWRRRQQRWRQLRPCIVQIVTRAMMIRMSTFPFECNRFYSSYHRISNSLGQRDRREVRWLRDRRLAMTNKQKTCDDK